RGSGAAAHGRGPSSPRGRRVPRRRPIRRPADAAWSRGALLPTSFRLDPSRSGLVAMPAEGLRKPVAGHQAPRPVWGAKGYSAAPGRLHASLAATQGTCAADARSGCSACVLVDAAELAEALADVEAVADDEDRGDPESHVPQVELHTLEP